MATKLSGAEAVGVVVETARRRPIRTCSQGETKGIMTGGKIMLTHYDKEKNRIYLANKDLDVDWKDWDDLEGEIKDHLAPLLPPLVELCSRSHSRRGKDTPFSIEIGIKSTAFKSLWGQDSKRLLKELGWKKPVFRFTKKGRYLSVKKIISAANFLRQQLEIPLQKYNDDETFKKEINAAHRRLVETLSMRTQDRISQTYNRNTPFTLAFGLATEEEVKSVYRLVREVCSL